MNDIKIDELISYIKNKLDNAELKLIENIRKENEQNTSYWRTNIEIYQNILTDIINTYSQEELMQYIKILEGDRDMYKTLYEQTTKMMEDIQKENKHLSDILNAKRVLDSFKYIKK